MLYPILVADRPAYAYELVSRLQVRRDVFILLRKKINVIVGLDALNRWTEA